MAALLCRPVHRLKMLRYLRVGVKTVHHMKPFRKGRRLLRKIRGASPAQDHHVNILFHRNRLVHSAHENPFCQNRNAFRVPPGKYCRQLHVRVVLNGALHPSPQISISHYSDPDRHLSFSFLYKKPTFLIPVICRISSPHCRFPYVTNIFYSPQLFLSLGTF